jgi:hypothetical protein
VKNSKAWFKGEKSREILSELYSPVVKFAKDADGNIKPYPPTLKIALKQRDGKFETQVYDDKKRPLTDVPLSDVLVKGAVLTTLIQCTGVWFAGGKFGLSFKAIQIRADKVPDSIRGFAFLDDGDSSDAPVARAPAKAAAAAAPAAAPSNAFAALHDDDDEVDDEEALAPPPVAAKPAAKVAAAPPPAVDPPADDDDEDAEDAAPIPVPAKKTTITKKKIIAAVPKK